MSSELRLRANRANAARYQTRLHVDYPPALYDFLLLWRAEIANEANNFFVSNKNTEINPSKSMISAPKRLFPPEKRPFYPQNVPETRQAGAIPQPPDCQDPRQIRRMPIAGAFAKTSVAGELLCQPAVAFLDRRLCLLQPARRVFRFGLPVSPAHQVLLEL